MSVEPKESLSPSRCIGAIGVAFTLIVGCSASESKPDQDAGDPTADLGSLGPCFQEHLLEAIELNELRRPRYSSLSGGLSEPISDSLIQGEKVSLLFARGIDEAAVPFHAAGVRIVCDEFIPMSETPEFRDRFPFDPEPLTSFQVVDGEQLRKDLEVVFLEEGYGALSALADARLHLLEQHRGYHCMLKHMLESIRRIANLAPLHDAHARDLGIQSPLPISRDMVELHFLSIDLAVKLDVQAASLQAEGLPIICQDVPPIPPWP